MLFIAFSLCIHLSLPFFEVTVTERKFTGDFRTDFWDWAVVDPLYRGKMGSYNFL